MKNKNGFKFSRQIQRDYTSLSLSKETKEDLDNLIKEMREYYDVYFSTFENNEEMVQDWIKTTT